MATDSLIQDTRYAIRGLRRAPLFTASVAGTIGLGLGILCSAFTIVNAYLFKPIDLPNPRDLYALSWETATAVPRQFTVDDVNALAATLSPLSAVAAGTTESTACGPAPHPRTRAASPTAPRPAGRSQSYVAASPSTNCSIARRIAHVLHACFSVCR